MKNPFGKDEFDNFIITVMLMAGMIYFTAITFLKVKSDNVTIQVLTIVGNIMMVIVGYKWGSSTGSKKKDDVIATMADNEAKKQTVEPLS